MMMKIMVTIKLHPITQYGNVETEASSYLVDPDRCLGMLHKYLLVKSVFIHFNTT